MSEYLGIAVFIALAAAFAAANIILATMLGPSKPSTVKSEPFECGKAPLSVPGGRLAIKFYLTAILFILFDVELIFLYPWAVVYLQLGASGLIQMAIFLGILMIGFFYAWDNGAMDWL